MNKKVPARNKYYRIYWHTDSTRLLASFNLHWNAFWHLLCACFASAPCFLRVLNKYKI